MLSPTVQTAHVSAVSHSAAGHWVVPLDQLLKAVFKGLEGWRTGDCQTADIEPSRQERGHSSGYPRSKDRKTALPLPTPSDIDIRF
ncbi:hypothetical protein CgunFtcFv8_003295 [Champsocephalus gunnari]|uniref:Uncharacterized protein n=1 Tax=Champsocephalus gunnari TaxID=52237 RepID=A0AAN8DE17_CHAGU|nr:hypothetical protein CgunFtcFv8_003295 [Champsocephalus gunnari]